MQEKNKGTLRERLRPKERTSGVRWLWTVLLLVFSAIGLCALCLMISTQDFSRGRFSSYFHEPVILLLNFLPVLLLIAFTYFVTNRAWLGFLIPSVLLTIMVFVNYFKIVLRGDPFVFDDIFSIGEGAGIAKEYTFVLPIWFFIAVLLLLAGVIVLLRYARGRFPGRLWWVRLIAAILCIAAGAFAWTQWYRNDGLYDRQHNNSLFNEWKDAENYGAHGFLYSFLHSVSAAIMPEPEGYSDEAAQQLLEEYQDVMIPEEKRVNVVVTMLESFSDLSVFDSIPFTKDPYQEFHALQAECYHGTLVSDTIGGGTINAERSFLTGFTYPQPHYRKNTNSYVYYFSASGYRTEGAHPGFDWFYSRDIINERLGFDRYLFMENYFNELTEEEHASDAVFFPALAKIYDAQTADGQPYFSFSVSYQNHSPYETSALLGEAYIARDGISDEAYYGINNYLDGVADTGKQISAYTDSFRDNEEPVVLVFFGDHKPTFGAENCHYEALGINVQENTSEGCWNLYTTPYLIWANDAAKELLGTDFTGEGETISPSYLMTVLFDCCGWDGPAWMQLQRDAMPYVPVMHQQKMFLSDGILTAELPEMAREPYRDYAIAEYYMRKTLHPYGGEE